MDNPLWDAEHVASGAPVGLVLYDKDDDLITIKVGPDEWAVYHNMSRQYGIPLNDGDIDRDRGDEIVGIVDELGTP